MDTNLSGLRMRGVVGEREGRPRRAAPTRLQARAGDASVGVYGVVNTEISAHDDVTPSTLPRKACPLA